MSDDIPRRSDRPTRVEPRAQYVPSEAEILDGIASGRLRLRARAGGAKGPKTSTFLDAIRSGSVQGFTLNNWDDRRGRVVQERMRREHKERPIAFETGRLLGSILNPVNIATWGMMGGSRSFRNWLHHTPAFAPASGALQGAAIGYGSAEEETGTTDRLANAAIGAGLGATVPILLAPALRGTGAVVGSAGYLGSSTVRDLDGNVIRRGGFGTGGRLGAGEEVRLRPGVRADDVADVLLERQARREGGVGAMPSGRAAGGDDMRTRQALDQLASIMDTADRDLLARRAANTRPSIVGPRLGTMAREAEALNLSLGSDARTLTDRILSRLPGSRPTDQVQRAEGIVRRAMEDPMMLDDVDRLLNGGPPITQTLRSGQFDNVPPRPTPGDELEARTGLRTREDFDTPEGATPTRRDPFEWNGTAPRPPADDATPTGGNGAGAASRDNGSDGNTNGATGDPPGDPPQPPDPPKARATQAAANIIRQLEPKVFGTAADSVSARTAARNSRDLDLALDYMIALRSDPNFEPPPRVVRQMEAIQARLDREHAKKHGAGGQQRSERQDGDPAASVASSNEGAPPPAAPKPPRARQLTPAERRQQIMLEAIADTTRRQVEAREALDAATTANAARQEALLRNSITASTPDLGWRETVQSVQMPRQPSVTPRERAEVVDRVLGALNRPIPLADRDRLQAWLRSVPGRRMAATMLGDEGGMAASTAAANARPSPEGRTLRNIDAALATPRDLDEVPLTGREDSVPGRVLRGVPEVFGRGWAAIRGREYTGEGAPMRPVSLDRDQARAIVDALVRRRQTSTMGSAPDRNLRDMFEVGPRRSLPRGFLNPIDADLLTLSKMIKTPITVTAEALVRGDGVFNDRVSMLDFADTAIETPEGLPFDQDVAGVGPFNLTGGVDGVSDLVAFRDTDGDGEPETPFVTDRADARRWREEAAASRALRAQLLKEFGVGREATDEQMAARSPDVEAARAYAAAVVEAQARVQAAQGGVSAARRSLALAQMAARQAIADGRPPPSTLVQQAAVANARARVAEAEAALATIAETMPDEAAAARRLAQWMRRGEDLQTRAFAPVAAPREAAGAR